MPVELGRAAVSFRASGKAGIPVIHATTYALHDEFTNIDCRRL
jgi:hypothetical protein